MKTIIEPQTGTAFTLKKGDLLRVTDIQGQQVSDLVVYHAADRAEKLSSGKTLDFEETLLLSTGNCLWSNRSRKMLEILEDTNGRNDFLLAPCSAETFTIMYGHEGHHPSCLENLATHLAPFGIGLDDIPTAFNIFMNVRVAPDGTLAVEPPTSKAGDYILFEALMDLVGALTACSAEMSNNGSFKPILVEITSPSPKNFCRDK